MRSDAHDATDQILKTRPGERRGLGHEYATIGGNCSGALKRVNDLNQQLRRELETMGLLDLELPLSVGVLSMGLLYGGESAAQRLKTAGVVFTEIMGTPDKGIPQELLESSQCIVIVPGMKKAAFIVGGNYGRGFMLCRKASGFGWSAPAGVKIEGGSGFRRRFEMDVGKLAGNKRGAENLSSNHFGADAPAAGPGRTASADTGEAHARYYPISLAGCSRYFIEGATLRSDED
jgi:hypothetical protein